MNAQTIPAVLTPHDLEELRVRVPRLRLLDVRTAGEFESMHIPGSYNVPLDRLGEHAAEIQTHVDDPVVLVCQSGARAKRAEEALRSAGMPQLHVLDGGMNGWTVAGRSVARGSSRISLERQVRMTAGAMVGVGGFLALLVNPLFALVPALVGSGLVFAAVTDTCAMGMALTRLPYNRPATCDVDAMVRALKQGSDPAGSTRGAHASPSSASCCA